MSLKFALLIPHLFSSHLPRGYYTMFTYCNRMLELFSSLVSYVLSGLKIYLAEKHIKQDLQGVKGPFGKIVAGSL